MATTFPNSIQTFPTMQNITASDAELVKQYQAAMQAGNIPQATAVLQQIADADKKLVTASLLNTLFDTNVALQQYYAKRFSNGYIVSANQPAGQADGDFWFKLGKTLA